jgi:predicted nuclease with TOPRIM domain
MSKNLSKASQWIQRDIDELKEKVKVLQGQAIELNLEMAEKQSQIAELQEVLEKIPSEKATV